MAIATDWRAVLLPDTSPLEIVVRGTLVYLGLLVLFRLILKRQWTGLGVQDLLVIVLVADASQNVMADDYRSVPDGLLLVAVIMAWAYLMDRLSYRFPLIDRMVKAPPLVLVEDGRMNRRNMRREFITEDELMTQIREQGFESVAQVRKAFMEPDGAISVIGRTQASAQGSRRKNRRAA